ncbi:MAG TPA: PQQ-binding-like beta-propeller repeat protein [Actinomycetota bacterium]
MRRLLPFLALGALLTAPLGARSSIGSCDWTMYGRDTGHSFAQSAECSEINALNAGALRPKWTIPTDTPVTASPSVVGGVVYVGEWDGTFYALDAETGAEIWRFAIDDGNSTGFGRIVSSAAIAEVGGKQIAVFGGGSTLYVLDTDPDPAQRKLASICLDPRDPVADAAERCVTSQADIEIESSPSIITVDGETWIVVGHSVHNRGDVGRTGVVALRLDPADWTLSPVWKFDPETLRTYKPVGGCGAAEPACVESADPLTHGHGSGGGCGGVWSSPAIDLDEGLVFFGTSNCTQDGDPPAGEVYGESIFSVDLRSGAYNWHYSPRGHNHVDDDFGASANLLPGNVVGNGGKDGRYYARNYADGSEAWTAHPARSGRLNTDFSLGGIIGTPAVGSVLGSPAIFAASAVGTPFEQPFDSGGNPFDPAALAEDPGRWLSLHAIDAATGEILWRSVSRQAFGAPTFVEGHRVADVSLGGVVFVPSTFSLSVMAIHADTGALLWEGQLQGAPSSAPAVVGDSIYLGTGTTVPPFPLDQLSGIWSFTLAA